MSSLSPAPAARPPSLWRRLWGVIDSLRRFTMNLVFLLILVVVVVAIIGGPSKPAVPDGAALEIELSGSLVEQRSPAEALAALLGEGIADEAVLHEVIDAIDRARADDRISAIVLRLDGMAGADVPKLTAIGDALAAFRKAGKRVVAIGDSFDQSQYFLASFADRVLLHPMGDVAITGFSAYDLFMREALDKLSVHMNVFRVGQYKAAVEPFLRDDMSPEARAANNALIASQWQSWRARVAANRRLSPQAIDDYVARFAQLAVGRGGDLARVALEARLIDELLTREAANAKVGAMLAANGEPNRDEDWPRVGMRDYRQAAAAVTGSSSERIGVVTVRGTIVVDDPNGGDAGANQILELLERARDDDSIKALVVRVDSPGGSAFGSELIRAELEALQLAGKPVVVSMSGLAASGGYWISATADEIWADPATITGSIGIFGLLPTFEKSLAGLGVRADGVSTSPLTTNALPFAPVSSELATVAQSSVEHGYGQFIRLVARGRDLPTKQVDEIAQGRVWTGADAKRLRLVDGLGGLDRALAAAARRAKLTDYAVERLEPTPNARQALLLQLAEQFGMAPDVRQPRGIERALDALFAQTDWLAALDDPRRLYALCVSCRVTGG